MFPSGFKHLTSRDFWTTVSVCVIGCFVKSCRCFLCVCHEGAGLLKEQGGNIIDSVTVTTFWFWLHYSHSGVLKVVEENPTTVHFEVSSSSFLGSAEQQEETCAGRNLLNDLNLRSRHYSHGSPFIIIDMLRWTASNQDQHHSPNTKTTADLVTSVGVLVGVVFLCQLSVRLRTHNESVFISDLYSSVLQTKTLTWGNNRTYRTFTKSSLGVLSVFYPKDQQNKAEWTTWEETDYFRSICSRFCSQPPQKPKWRLDKDKLIYENRRWSWEMTSCEEIKTSSVTAEFRFILINMK